MQLRVLVLLACVVGVIQAKIVRLSCKQIQRFVDGHNSRRLQLAQGVVKGQPAATDMKMMVWDEELAAKAAKWAKRNAFEHNPDTSIASKRFKCGENLYWYGTSDKKYVIDPDMALKEWFEEHKHYTHKPMVDQDFTGPQVGHYTQMAWADSTLVGCAISEYFEKGWKNFLVVCNYGPTGNWMGESPYRAGHPSKRLTCEGDRCKKKYGNKC